MTTYEQDVCEEVKSNCIKAIIKLEQEIEWTTEAYLNKVSKLRVRLKYCKKTIKEMDRKLETIIT